MRTNALDSEQVKRKPHLEQNRLHPDSGNRHFKGTLQVLCISPKNYRASSKQTNKQKKCQLYLNR